MVFFSFFKRFLEKWLNAYNKLIHMRWLYAVGYLSKMPHTDKNDMCETNYRFFLFHLVYTTQYTYVHDFTTYSNSNYIIYFNRCYCCPYVSLWLQKAMVWSILKKEKKKTESIWKENWSSLHKICNDCYPSLSIISDFLLIRVIQQVKAHAVLSFKYSILYLIIRQFMCQFHLFPSKQNIILVLFLLYLCVLSVHLNHFSKLSLLPYDRLI